MCVTLHISATKRTDSNWNTYSYYSDKIDGRYAEGSIGDRAFRLPSAEAYKETAIAQTLDYLSVNFQNVYGRPMTRNDICGEESYKSPEQIANDIAAAAAYKLKQEQEALAKEAEQLALKAAMLKSQDAVWASEGIYHNTVVETNNAINAYNLKVQDFTPAPNTGLENRLITPKPSVYKDSAPQSGIETKALSDNPVKNSINNLLTALSIPFIFIIVILYLILKR